MSPWIHATNSLCPSAAHPGTVSVLLSAFHAQPTISSCAQNHQAYTFCCCCVWFLLLPQMLDTCCRFQDKFKHLWDASDRSVRSAAAVTALETPSTEVPPGPLEHALSTRGVATPRVGATPRGGATPRVAHRSVSNAEGMHAEGAQMSQSAKQGSTALGLTGRLSSLFFGRNSLEEYSQHEDDLSGTNYSNRDY